MKYVKIVVSFITITVLIAFIIPNIIKDETTANMVCFLLGMLNGCLHGFWYLEVKAQW
ncbi:MAG: hypothetical protein ABIB11_05035 [Candidatus Omnitrophota bacterium]